MTSADTQDLREQLAKLPAATYPIDASTTGAIAHSKQLAAVAAICCEAFRRRGLRAVLVGGGVIEFMMPGAYTTPDIDLVVSHNWLKPPRSLVNTVFESIGFHSAGSRHWIRGGWFVEVPDFDITDPTVTVEVAGHTMTMVVPESVLVARLVEFDQTGHTGHATQALMMLAVLEDTLDADLLLKLAQSERVDDLLTAARALVAQPEQPTLTDALLRELRERVRSARYPLH